MTGAVRRPSSLLRVLLALLLVAGGLAVLATPAQAAPCTAAQTAPITAKYVALGGATSVVGTPVGAPYTAGSGCVQDYTRGLIAWSSATGAHEVHGAISTRYRALGGPGGFLRFPLTDERTPPDGVGRYSQFQGGSVYWSPSTGAHEVYGAIRTKWQQLGSETSALGYPITGERPTPDGVGRYNHFQRGSIYWTPSTGAHEVRGAIWSKWRSLGWETGFLGYPLTDERPTPDGVGRYNHFQGGSVYWTPSTGAHEVHGSIRSRWAALGWETGELGYPITDEFAVPGGRQSSFEGGFLRWTAATHVVRTAILEPYEHAGTWVTRFRFSREYGGANPVIAPADVDAMAAAGVKVIYLQAAADDPRFPGLLSPDLLGQFLTRAHARGMQVVAWYLPHLTDVNADLARLRAMAAFRASGHAFDAIGVDIEDRTVADVATRNARLVDLSRRLAAALPGVTLSAIVLPPVVLDVINTAYWPNFPWRQIAPYYQVWQPMAYWSNRTDPVYSDAYRYTSENITRLRADLGEPCAAVSTIGGFGTTETTADYAGMARAATDRGAVGVSVFDWTTTPSPIWSAIRGYDVRGPC
jgi:LGFP repeat